MIKVEYVDTNILVSRLVEANIGVEEFLILVLVINSKNNEKTGTRTLQQYLEVREPLKNAFFEKMVDKGLIDEFQGTPTSKNINPTEKFKTIFLKSPKDEDFLAFVQSYMELWPKGIKTMGHYIRGDKLDCIKKLRRLFIDNPEISQDRVLEVTRNYIERFQRRNYEGITTSNYFINREGRGSLLMVECEQEESQEESQFNNHTKDV